MLKFKNLITIFENGNYFSKIKEEFRSSGNYFPLIIILRRTKHRKIKKKKFKNHFISKQTKHKNQNGHTFCGIAPRQRIKWMRQ